MAKILMVDDDTDFVSACQTILETKGHTIVTAFNVSEAEEQISKENPELILLDKSEHLPHYSVHKDHLKDRTVLPGIWFYETSTSALCSICLHPASTAIPSYFPDFFGI